MKRLAYIAMAALMTMFVMISCKEDPVKPIDNKSSIKLISYDEVVEGSSTTKDLEAYAVIQNISTSDKQIIFKMEEVEKTVGHTILFCALENCWQAGTDGTVITAPRLFKAGEIEADKDFHLTLSPNGKTGKTKLKFTAYVADDPEDKIVFYITYNVTL